MKTLIVRVSESGKIESGTCIGEYEQSAVLLLD